MKVAAAHELLKRLAFDGRGFYSVRTGARAAKHPDGYPRWNIIIKGKRFHFYEHHLAWVYHHNEWPDFQNNRLVIDHRDDDKTNQSRGNLRLVTKRNNCRAVKHGRRSGAARVL
jgi:hypothetical protein